MTVLTSANHVPMSQGLGSYLGYLKLFGFWFLLVFALSF